MSDATTPADLSTLRDTVRGLMPQLRADLEALTRIPSVSLPAFDQSHVDASAEATAELLRAEGLDVEIVREGGAPAVIGHIDGPEGAPTVMLRQFRSRTRGTPGVIPAATLPRPPGPRVVESIGVRCPDGIRSQRTGDGLIPLLRRPITT